MSLKTKRGDLNCFIIKMLKDIEYWERRCKESGYKHREEKDTLNNCIIQAEVRYGFINKGR